MTKRKVADYCKKNYINSGNRNERISVLEKHLGNLKSQVHTKDSYRGKVNELSRSLRSKSDECESLVDELSELHAVVEELMTEIDQNTGDNSKSSTVVDQAKEALQRNELESSQNGVGRRKSARAMNSRKGSQPLLRHTELMASFDSEDDNEEPEWANDIMADLALIADGKIPPSLEESFAIADGKTKYQLESTSSVFDRLADPQSFTGTQKQIQSTKRDTGNVHKVNSNASSRVGQQDRRAMSREIFDCLDKVVVPGETEASVDEEAIHDGKDRASSKDAESEGDNRNHRSVFDRLLSPSQYTGTQKEKIQTSRAKKGAIFADEAATRLLDDLLSSEERETNPNDSSSHSLYSDYTQLNMFEGLQKTTTQAYAVKHGGGVGNDAAVHHVTPPPSGNLAGVPARREGSEHESVFERLTKTTTEAYAKKTKHK